MIKNKKLISALVLVMFLFTSIMPSAAFADSTTPSAITMSGSSGATLFSTASDSTTPSAGSTTSSAATTTQSVYSITVDSSIANGSVSVDPTEAKAGATITVTATPDNGYALAGITAKAGDDSVDVTVNGNTGAFTMPDADVEVSAEFEAVVTISDENLRKEICEELGKDYVAGVGITQTEMESLTQLDAANAGITNITGLKAAINLKSLNLSGNTGIYKALTTLTALNSLETLDLSSCGFTESKNLIALLSLPNLKSYSIADNDLVGYFTLPDSKVNVESLDLSGNLLAGVDGGYSKELYPNLKELNISKTLVVWNDVAEEYEDLVLNGVNVIHDEPQSKATLYRVLYEGTSSIPSEDADIDQKTRTISFSILGDSVNIVFVSGAETDTSKVTIRDEKVTVLSYSDTSDKAKSAAMYRVTGLTEGENSIPVTVMYLDGSTVEYTLKITSTKYNTNDEVYIKDAVVYKYLCKTLGKSYTEGYVITKENLATITNLKIPVCTDISWLQYCTKVQKVNTEDSVSDYMMLDKNASTYESVPDLSGLTALRELTLNSTNLKEVPDLSVLSGNSRFQKLYISATVDGKLPDVSSLSKLTTITVAHSKGDLPTGMASLTKLKTVYLMNNDSAKFQLSKDNLPSTLTTLQVSNEGATITIGDMTGIGQFDLTANYGGTDKFVFTAPDKVTFTLAYSEYKGSSANFPTNMNELTGLKGFSLTNCKFDGAVTWNESFNNMTGLTSVAFNNSGLTEIPKWLETATNLTSIKVSNDNITQFDVDLSKHTALKTVDCSSLKLGSMPSADLLPTSLTTLILSNQIISDFNVDYSKFTNLTKLEIQGNRIYEIPAFIKGISSLQELNISRGFYDEIQENAFGDLNNLTKLTVGNYLPVNVTEYPEWDMVVYSLKEGTTTANEIARLSESVKANGKTLQVVVEGAVETTKFADLERVTVGDDCYYEDNGSFNIDLSSGTNQIALNAQAIYSGTTITLGDKTVTGSGTFELELKEGYNEFTVKTHVDSVDARNPEGTDKVYSLNIYVGEMSSIDSMETGHYYNVNCTILKANTQKESMAGGYFSDKAQIRKRVDGTYEIYLTCNKMSWVNDLATYDETGNRCEADIISQDEENDILKARVIMNSIPVPFVMNMYVAPMGYYPNCDVYLDLTSLQDITDSMPQVDMTELNIAVNKAEEIAAKNNIYTDATYSALETALTAAKNVAANANASQEEVDAAEESLNVAIDALVVDASKLADKTALTAAINEAKAIEKGTKTQNAWTALQDAIAEAESINAILEATQAEVDAAVTVLSTAVQTFKGSSNATDVKTFLEKDGNYYVSIELRKADDSDTSMGDVAFENNRSALVTVKNGKITKVQVATNPVKVEQYYSAITAFEVEGTDVEVLSKGEITTEPAGNDYDYIKLVEFVLPSAAQPSDDDDYTDVDVIFYVPDTPMDDVVGDELSATLRFYWDTAEKTSSDELKVNSSTAKGKSETLSEAVDITDKTTGIRLKADEDVLPEDTKMTVETITSGTYYDAAVSALDGIAEDFKLYSIVVKADGEEVEPSRTVSIYFPIPADYDGTKVAVYRINEDGTKVVVKGELEKGNYIIDTKTFGVYALALTDEVLNQEKYAKDIQKVVEQYTDLAGHWAVEPLASMVNRGLMAGVADNQMAPDTTLNRAMMVTLLHRMAGDTDPGYGGYFSDVSDFSWYVKSVSWASLNGIAQGVGDGKFAPEQAITREQIAVMLVNYAKLMNIELPQALGLGFSDADSVSDWADEAVRIMVSAKIIGGYPDGTLRPTATATRAEAAAMLDKFLTLYVDPFVEESEDAE